MLFKTWLLQGIFHSAPGYIQIEGDMVSLTLVDTGTFGKRKLNALLKRNDVFESLTNDETIEVFQVSRKAARYQSPWYMLSGGGVVSFSGKQYKLSFMQPQNTKFPYQRLGIIRESDFTDFKDGREFGKRFRLFMDGQDNPW
ncbi:hypothetical protein JC525_15425 [Alteromonas sp. IB21]|uniref:hypothetical protein n=1 Tax=Alteromonas sp. IB21 TaxID=2779369 RepID=UPI0018E8BE64|nr:hypothetical protein [Alteromonas sp. IB21]MBJ2130322.1 hypothetical protein [Alteromonas sp. IB21]